MHRPAQASHAFWSVLLLIVVQATTASLRAQVSACGCGATKPFGNCRLASTEYPGQSPGSTAVVAVGDTRFVVVADHSDGFVYRFTLSGNRLNLDDCGNGAPFCFPSPLGSLPTPSGLVYSATTNALFWAIDGTLYRSIPDIASLSFLSSVEPLATIDMETLAILLDLPTVGTLGDITYHAERDTFWGVDIVNDVYFEFDLDGQPVADGGSAVHFRNPRSSGPGAAAFGNSISYARVDGTDYFDITVGSLTDGTVSFVERVFAGEGEMGGTPYTIGDSAGIYYDLTAHVADGSHVTGLAFLGDACTPGQDAQILLEFGSGPAGVSRVLAVNADLPAATGLTRFECTTQRNNVDLMWTTLDDFQTLNVTRIDTVTGELREVSLGEDIGAAGTTVRTDKNVTDGTYEYRAALVSTDGNTYSERRCRVTVGRGSVVASTSFITDAAPNDTLPFAVTAIGSTGQILVADFTTGNAHLYNSDLELEGILPGAFHSTLSFVSGSTSGVAWSSTSDEIVWVQDRGNGINLVQRTRLTNGEGGPSIELIADAVSIPSPLDLIRPSLGDIAHDPVLDQFWTVDRNSGVAYSFLADGNLSGASFTKQLASPRQAGVNAGLAGGGLALAESTNGSLVLDWVVGGPNDDAATALDRVSYTRNVTDGNDDVSSPGTTDFTVDLVTVTGSLQIGGIINVEEGADEYQYVVAWGTRRIFKLLMTEGLAGKKFRRGDANGDGIINISDPSFILAFLFKGGRAPPCTDAADATDDEVLGITDAVVLFRHLFMNGPAPAEPYQDCGRDFDDGLACNLSTCS